MQFLKTHGRLISNVLVVILVIMAIFVKIEENGTGDLVHENDIYIFAGVIIAFLLLNMFKRSKRR